MAVRRVSWAELEEYLQNTKVSRGIEEVVLHHTWSPSAAQYAGQATWDGIRRYHMAQRGWSDIGYHFGVGPDGSLWRLRPVNLSGAHVLNRNLHTVGVAIVGNFDVEDPMTHGLPAAAKVVAKLLQRFRLGPAAVRFHREFQDKTCPGTRVNQEVFRKMVKAEMGEAKAQTVKLVDAKTGEVVGSLVLAPNGDHIADQGKLYVVKA